MTHACTIVKRAKHKPKTLFFLYHVARARNLEDAIGLVRHGFLEWILNQHIRPYLRLVDKIAHANCRVRPAPFFLC
jgi:hypothetical protein